MIIGDAGNCMLQYPLVPTTCNLGIKTEEERFAEMSDDEKAAFREKLIEKMHADNLCYSGCFSLESSLVKTGSVAAKESDASNARERQGKARHETRHEVPLEMSGAE
jgi:hypothetical protein